MHTSACTGTVASTDKPDEVRRQHSTAYINLSAFQAANQRHLVFNINTMYNVKAPICVQAGQIRTGSAFHIAVWAPAEEWQISDSSHRSGLQL